MMQRIIASWYGTGLILRKIRGSDTGSGTVGALAAGVIAYWLYQTIDWPMQVIAALAVTTLSLWSVRVLVDTEGDAGWIVVDEAAGIFVALIAITSIPAAIVAFVVYRAADIFKSVFPGVLAAERIPGALGVTADDLIAGLYGLAAGQIVLAFT